MGAAILSRPFAQRPFAAALPWTRQAAALLCVALAYWVSGKLGLLLAIPPGYATAVWPPSGIALAAVLLLGPRAALGVWLGSFLVNIGNSLDVESVPLLLRSVGAPALIAAGAAVQALLGGWLIQRFVGYCNVLTQELDVAVMLILGGPVACLFNATLGATTLWGAGAISDDGYLFSWGTWWVGDAIGVLVFTPLILVWALAPRALWLRRQLYATAPLLALFALVVLTFFYTSQRESRRIEAEFHGHAADFTGELQRNLSDFTALSMSLRGLFESSDVVTASEFDRFTTLIQAQIPSVVAMCWAPLVRGDQRRAFEAAEAAAKPGFSIQQATSSGPWPVLAPSAVHGEYAPVLMLSHPYEDSSARGFDLYSEPRRAAALRRAARARLPSITDPLHLVQDPASRTGMLIVVPVFGQPDAGHDDSVGPLRGFVTAALRAPDMFALSVSRLESHGLLLELAAQDDAEDGAAASGGMQPIYHSKGWRTSIKGDLSWNQPVQVLGRSWSAHFVLPSQYLVEHRSLEVWTVLTGGLLFTGLFGIFVLVIIGRTSRIELLVAERTADLAREVAHSTELQHATRLQADKLAASNRDLEQFAYVASHDLQAPLRTVASFAGLLETRYSQVLDAKGQDFLDAIVEGAQEMKSRIKDLLELSRVNSERVQMEPTELGEVVDTVRKLLAKDLADSGAELAISPLPRVHGDPNMLEQLFQNLISNAVKFQKGGQRARVEIRAEALEGQWRISVRDNGIGMSKPSIQEIFVMFRRLHAADKYSGTGIGLAICKRIVDLHHGAIEVESEIGVGSVFTVVLPM